MIDFNWLHATHPQFFKSNSSLTLFKYYDSVYNLNLMKYTNDVN